MVGNEREPILYVFDEATFEFVSSPAKQVGSMAFSTDKDYFYYWNTITGFLHKYSIDGNVFTEVGTSKSSCLEQWICPFDIPIFLNGSDEIICKRSIFKQNDLSMTKSPFSEDIYAINSEANIVLGQTGFYDLKTGIKIENISLKGAKSFYLDQDRSLIYEKDNILKISMFTGTDVVNASKISLLRNQATQIGVLGNYSDGRTSDFTYKSTFETSNADIVQVSPTGLITANNMGTADITIQYGSFAEIIKVEVGVVGDYNGDTEVNSIDFAVLRQYLLGIIKSLPVNDEMYIGDLNRDGNINSIDFAILRRYLLGTFTELPIVS